MVGRSAASGLRLYDGLAEAVDHNFILFPSFTGKTQLNSTSLSRLLSLPDVQTLSLRWGLSRPDILQKKRRPLFHRRHPVHKQPHKFDEFIAGILSVHINKVLNSGVELSFSGKCGTADIKIDGLLIEQAVLNIIDNALVHGGNKLKSISVSTRKNKNYIYLSMCNDGICIPASSRRHLFERFEQGQATERRSRAGAGLGLPIVKEICVSHQADISVTSITAKTCFQFRFVR